MKKLLALLGTLLWMGSVSFAQNTTVSGTVVDADGTTWANGTIAVQFVPNPSQPNIGIYNINGIPLSTAVMTQGPVSLGGGGTFSLSVYQNAVVTPGGSTWQYTICPNASAKCGVFTVAAVGSTQNLTASIPALIPVPRFLTVAGAYGYADIETINQQPVGGTYWNTSASCQKYYNSLSWNCVGTVGGAVIAVTASAPIVSSGGTTPNITCTTANTSTTGCISSTDWNTFNNKQTSLGFTPYNATNPAGYITNSVTTLPSLSISNTQVSGLGTASTHPYTDFEMALGNPEFTGYVLSSTSLGVRSWVPQNVGISSINGGTGAYTFNGPVVSCVSTTCTFTDVNLGTVTTVGLVMPSIFTVTNSPVTTTGALTASLNSQLQNLFLASPNGSSGIPTFRAIAVADVPILNQNTTGTSSNVTGTVLVANGGTGCTTAPCALTNLGAASLASPTFTGTVGAPVLQFGSGWNLLNSSNTAPLAWGTLPWSGPGNFMVVDQDVNAFLAGIVENDSLGPAAEAGHQYLTNSSNTYGTIAQNGVNFFQNVGNNFGNAPNTIWGSREFNIWADDSSSFAGLTLGAGYTGSTCFHGSDSTNRPYDPVCQMLLSKNIFYLQDATPTIAPALTLTQAIKQTAFSVTPTSISGTAPNMTINATLAGGGSNAYANWAFTITGSTNPSNVQSFICTGSSTTQLTGCDMPTAVAETFPAGAKLFSIAGTTYVGTITGGAHNAYTAVGPSKIGFSSFVNSGNNCSTVLCFAYASSANAIATWNSAGVNETHAGQVVSMFPHSSTTLDYRATYNTGSASANDDFTVQNVIGGLTANPSATLTHAHTGTSGAVSETFPYPVSATTLTQTGCATAATVNVRCQVIAVNTVFTATQTAQTLIASTTAGQYQISYYIWSSLTYGGTGSNCAIQFSANNGSFATSPSATTIVLTGAADTASDRPITLHLGAATALTYTPTITAASPTGNCNVNIIVERLQ